MRESAGLKLVLLFISYEVSRGPKVNMRKSRSSKVSCEVSCQIGLVITSKPYSSCRSVNKTFASHVYLPGSNPTTHNFYNITIFYELLKPYREGLSSSPSSGTSLVITHNFMILRVGCR